MNIFRGFKATLTLFFVFIFANCLFAAVSELKIGSNKVGSTWYVQASCIASMPPMYSTMAASIFLLASSTRVADRKSVV